MPMPILDVLGPSHVVHSANRAGAWLIAAAAFAVHRAYIGGSILLALRMGFAQRGGHLFAVAMPLMVAFFMAVRFAVMAVCISGVATTGG